MNSLFQAVIFILITTGLTALFYKKYLQVIINDPAKRGKYYYAVLRLLYITDLLPMRTQYKQGEELLENRFLNGSQISPYSHDASSLFSSRYGGGNTGWRNSIGLKVLQEVQNMPLNMNQGLKPRSDGYLWDKIMMPGLNYLVPIGAPKY